MQNNRDFLMASGRGKLIIFLVFSVLFSFSVFAAPPNIVSKGVLEIPASEVPVALYSSPNGELYSLVTKSTIKGVITKKQVFYVYHGSQKLGPLEEFHSVDKDTWRAVESAGKSYLGSGGDFFGPFSGYSTVTMVKSAKNKQLAFQADVDDAGAFLLVGDQKIGPFAAMSDLEVSTKDNSFAFSARKNDNAYVYKDLKVIAGPFKWVWGLHWSPDGSVLVYCAETDAGSFIYSGAAPVAGPFTNDPIRSVSFAPDGKTIVAMVGKSIIAGKEQLGPFDGNVSGLVFSPDGNRFAFTVEEKKGVSVHLDSGESVGPFVNNWDSILNYSFSPDSRHFICTGADLETQKTVIYQDGQKTLSNTAGAPVLPLFSKDSRKLAFAVDVSWDKWVLQNGSSQVDFDCTLSYGFQADGSLVYWSQTPAAKKLTSGDKVVGEYDIVADLSTPAKFQYLALKNNTLSLISFDR